MLRKTREIDRIKINHREEFTIPETAALFCSGGGIFMKGISIGDNKSVIPGSIKFSENKLQFLNCDKTLNITGYTENNCKENSIVKFSKNGEITNTDILIEENDIVGIDVLEAECIIPPNKTDLTLKNNKKNINLYAKNIKLNSTFIDSKGKLYAKSINFLSSPPKKSNSSGTKGDYAYDEDYMYMCVSKDIWKRSKLDSW